MASSDGTLRAAIEPVQNSPTIRCQSRICPVRMSVARPKVRVAFSNCAPISTCRLSSLSARMPPNRENNRNGMRAQKLTSPMRNSVSVRVTTSQPWATTCIHIPRLAAMEPPKNVRNSGIRNAPRVPLQIGSCGGASESSTPGLITSAGCGTVSRLTVCLAIYPCNALAGYSCLLDAYSLSAVWPVAGSAR